MRRFAVLLMVVLVAMSLFSLRVALAQVQEQPERSYGKEGDAEEVRALILEKTRKENEDLRKELDRLTAALEQLRAKQQRVAEEQLDKGTAGEPEAAQNAEKAAEEQLQNQIEQRRFEQFQKAMEQLQREMEQLQSQREKLEADLSQEVAKKHKALEDILKRIEEQKHPKAVNLEGGVGVTDLVLALSKASPASAADARAAYDAAIAQYKVSTQTQELEDAMLSKGDAGLIAILRFEKVKLYRKLRMYDPAVQELRQIIEQNLGEPVTEAARWTLVEILQEQKEKEAAIAELGKILTTTDNARKKKDALYGIINLLGDDPDSKLRAIEQLIRRLEGRQPGIPVSEEAPVSLLPPTEPPAMPGLSAAPAMQSLEPSSSSEPAPVVPAVELPVAAPFPG